MNKGHEERHVVGGLVVQPSTMLSSETAAVLDRHADTQDPVKHDPCG